MHPRIARQDDPTLLLKYRSNHQVPLIFALPALSDWHSKTFDFRSKRVLLFNLLVSLNLPSQQVFQAFLPSCWIVIGQLMLVLNLFSQVLLYVRPALNMRVSSTSQFFAYWIIWLHRLVQFSDPLLTLSLPVPASPWMQLSQLKRQRGIRVLIEQFACALTQDVEHVPRLWATLVHFEVRHELLLVI